MKIPYKIGNFNLVILNFIALIKLSNSIIIVIRNGRTQDSNKKTEKNKEKLKIGNLLKFLLLNSYDLTMF